MLDKDHLKQLYEAGYENLALSLAVVLYCKEKSSKFYKKHKLKIKSAISFISAYALLQSWNYWAIINQDLANTKKAN